MTTHLLAIWCLDEFTIISIHKLEYLNVLYKSNAVLFAFVFKPSYNPSYFLEESMSTAENYCRNFKDADTLWCYTTDNDTRWDYCDLPLCSVGKYFVRNFLWAYCGFLAPN